MQMLLLPEKSTGKSGDAVTPGPTPAKEPRRFPTPVVCRSCMVPAPASCCTAQNASAHPGHWAQYLTDTTLQAGVFFRGAHWS